MKLNELLRRLRPPPRLRPALTDLPYLVPDAQIRKQTKEITRLPRGVFFVAALAPHNNSDVAELLKTYSERGASLPSSVFLFGNGLAVWSKNGARNGTPRHVTIRCDHGEVRSAGVIAEHRGTES
jgi:hypothetical protein